MSPPTLPELEEELRRDSRSRRFFELAREYQKLGRLGEAQDTCEKGLSAFPNHWQARLLLSQIYVTKGKLSDAQQMVEKVLLAFHDSVPANHLAADIYWALGEREKALRHYQIVDLLQPGQAGVQERLADLQRPAEASLEPERVSSPEAAQLESLDQPLEEVAAPSVEEDAGALLAPPALPSSPQGSSTVIPPPADKESGEAEAQENPWGETAAPVSELDEDTASFASVLDPVNGEAAAEGILQGGPSGENPPKQDLSAEAQEEAGQPEDQLAKVRSAVQPGLNTVTLAELYERQGYPEKAVEIYQRLLLQGPESPAIRGRIRDLMTRMAGEIPEAPAVRQEDVEKAMRQKRILVLQNWLRRVREGRHV